MKRSRKDACSPVVVVIFSLAAGVGCGRNNQAADSVMPIARVVAVRAEVGTLTETLVSYGTVVAAPGAQQTPSVPFESIVDRVLVTDGMPVSKGQTLVVLRPSPAALTQIKQAQAALMTAEDLLHAAQQRDSLGLSTRDELIQASQTLNDAQARYEDVVQWQQRGRVTAPAAGVVTNVKATEGALLPQGAPLVDLALQGRFEVRLGVEPEDIDRIRPGQPVTVNRVGRSEVIARGTIRSVGRAVNPETRLVDVMVTTPGSDTFLFGETVRGAIDVQSQRSLIVPRSALLPADGVYRVFSVERGLAHERLVTIGMVTDSLVEVVGGISAGDSVVVLGNYILHDSMRVRIARIGSIGARQ